MNQPLQGLTVIEAAGVLAGPLVGMFLAEYGARVIKIEPTGRGDVTRTWKLSGEPESSTLSSYFCCANWGKSSVTLNLKSVEGREVFYELTSQSDMVLTSYKAGDAEKLKVSYEDLIPHNERLIYGSITGFGDGDPRPAFDAVVQAESGFMHMNGTAESGPLKMPVALMDVLAAHHLKEKLLLALLHQQKTGEGTQVSVSLMEAALASLANQGSAWLVAGSDPQPMGSEHPHIYPYGSVFETGDGLKILLAIGNDDQFKKLTQLLGDDSISEDSRFTQNPDRSANRNQLRPLLADLFQSVQNGRHFLEDMKSAKIPCGAILPVSEAIENYGDESMLSGYNPEFGNIRGIATANPHTSDLLEAPEELGASTSKILQEFTGITSSGLEQLKKRGVISMPDNQSKSGN